MLCSMTTPADVKHILGSMAGRRVIAQEIADALGISRNAANDRMNRGLDAEDAIKVARSLEINPVELLVELGHLSHEDVFNFMDSDGTSLATATQEQLIYRLAEDTLSPSEKLGLAQSVLGQDDLAARRSNTSSSDVDPVPYAANHRTPEPEEGDDDYGPGA